MELGLGEGRGNFLRKRVALEIRLKDICEFRTGALGRVKQAKEAEVTRVWRQGSARVGSRRSRNMACLVE